MISFNLIFSVLVVIHNVQGESTTRAPSSTTAKTPGSTTWAPPTPSPSAYVYKSYQTSVYCTSSSPVQYPRDIREVQQIIKVAIANGQKVKAFGSRHSLTDVICTAGVPISMGAVNYTTLNDDGTATVGAGAEMKDVLEMLHEKGRTLIHVPAFGGISVGGAMGTGAHGSSLLHPPSLSDQAVRFTIIDGLGNIRVVDGGEDLQAFRVHLGLLGAIIDVTLQTVPLFKMVVQNTVESENILLNGTAISEAKVYDWYQMWWFPSNKQVVVSRGNYTDDISIPGNATTNMIPDESPAEIGSARSSFETLQGTRNKRGLYAIQDFTQNSLHSDVVGKPPIYTEDGENVANPATGFAHRLQANRCSNKCPWDNGNNSIYPEESAMAFDMYELPKIITSMKSILAQVQATFPMVGVFIRFSKSSDALMAIENGRESVHVEWASPMRNDPYVDSRDAIGAYQAILQSMLKEHGGRPHWGKNGPYYLSQEVIAHKRTRNLEQFVRIMKKYDPNGLFMNKFGRRLTGASTELTYDPAVRRCALQDYCICKVNQDCANMQTCGLVNGHSVCLEPLGNIPMRMTNYDSTNMTSINEAVASISH